LAVIASFNSGRPPAGVYRCHFGNRAAAIAASTMYPGVGKSGSPAPKPITGRPAAFRALALASTAKVADSVMAAMRRETRAVGGKVMEGVFQAAATGFAAVQI
jgi:hypothetical protein